MNVSIQKLKVCAQIIENINTGTWYFEKHNCTILYYTVKCFCKSNRICFCSYYYYNMKRRSNIPFKKKKFDRPNQDLRKVRCKLCESSMSWTVYWSYDHICFALFASYDFENPDDENDLATFLPDHKWYHDCKTCSGLFEISQWRYKKIWYHTACTEENKFFYKNLKKFSIIKYTGNNYVKLYKIPSFSLFVFFFIFY